MIKVIIIIIFLVLFTYYWLPEKISKKELDDLNKNLVYITKEKDEWKKMCKKLNNELYNETPVVIKTKNIAENTINSNNYENDYDISQFF